MRERDEIWDALTDVFGEIRTQPERARRNEAVKQLREAQATPEEIAIAYAWCNDHFSPFTEMAIVTNFGRAQYEARKTTSIDAAIDEILGRES